jgi:hypothetical protein
MRRQPDPAAAKPPHHVDVTNQVLHLLRKRHTTDIMVAERRKSAAVVLAMASTTPGAIERSYLA